MTAASAPAGNQPQPAASTQPAPAAQPAAAAPAAVTQPAATANTTVIQSAPTVQHPGAAVTRPKSAAHGAVSNTLHDVAQKLSTGVATGKVTSLVLNTDGSYSGSLDFNVPG